jgi:hypothetical protein
MAALISFKVDPDPATGIPSRNLTSEAVKIFKTELGLDIKLSNEACGSP